VEDNFLKVFVISDLHLGGRPHSEAKEGSIGSQICSSYGELTAFIDSIATQIVEYEPIELVVNGDIVDFLMEDDYDSNVDAPPWLPDENKIIEKLDIIIQRTREGKQRGPFDAMSDLLGNGGHLTFILGNHDIELSLPKVRNHLEVNVFGKYENGRFKFIYDGEAYVKGDLLIEHGNRYDSWNIIDHSALRQERSMLSRGLGAHMLERDTGYFSPPPGSVLVSKVINKVKQHYRFVDLLKPEDKAVIPILFVLHPNLKHIMKFILQGFYQADNDFLTPTIPNNNGQLSTEGRPQNFDLSESLKIALGDESNDFFSVPSDTGSQLGASDIWERVKTLSNNIDIWIDDQFNVFKDASQNQLLYTALKCWRNKLSIDQNREEPQYESAAKELANNLNLRCVVFGHTHLPKEIEVIKDKNEKFIYLNTGTWADIMEFPVGVLDGDAVHSDVFANFIGDLKNNKLDEYITKKLCYAEINLADNSVVSAELKIFNNKDSKDTPCH
jgi:UDP-2,3-diacylglucosamine pyrophosphatase LpxH